MTEKVQEPPKIVYPESDGKPMAENTIQFRWIQLIQGNLDALFADREDVFVAGDLLWYPVEGHPEINMAPDTMVAFGRHKGDRGSYRQWEEGGVAPQVVCEVISPSNTRREMDAKREWYQKYGVEEYYEYDPERIRLRGWVRDGDELREVEAMDGWESPRLGVRFDMSGEELTILGPDGRAFRPVRDSIRRADRLAAKLRELGIDPDSLDDES